MLFDCNCTAGKTVIAPGGGHVHVYPYNGNNVDGPTRDSLNHQRFGNEAMQIRQPVGI